MFLIRKEVGLTSFDVIRELRNLFDSQKMGHCGTLDPIAEGLLLVLSGKGTRLVEYIHKLDKEYHAEIKLGEQTTTDDRTGKTIFGGDISNLDEEDVEKYLSEMRGYILQQPPAFSAVKVEGVRAYKKARSGYLTPPEKRLVHIEEITIREFNPPLLSIKVVCGTGTYVRSIARELGSCLGCGAHLSSLIRTRIGPYSVYDSITINQLSQLQIEDNDEECGFFINIDDMLPWIDFITLGDGGWRRLSNGSHITRTDIDADLVRLLNSSDEFVGIGEVREDRVYPKKMLKLYSDVKNI